MKSDDLKTTQGQRARQAGVVFVLALAVRLAYSAWRGPVASADTNDYFILAKNLLVHGTLSLDASTPFEASIRRAPAYPAFLALLAVVGGTSPATVVCVQAILDAGVTVVVFLLGKGTGRKRWGRVLPAAVYACHPGAVLAAASLLSEALFTALLAGSAWLLVVGLQKNRLKLLGMAGCVLAIAILCRPNALLLPVAVAAVLQFAPGVRRPAIAATVFVGVVVTVVCPWIIRSSMLASRFVPVQAYGAVNLYVATRLDWDWKKEELWQRQAPYVGVLTARTPQEMSDLDRWFMRQAIRNIAFDPGGYIASRVKALPFLVLTSFDKVTGFNESFGTILARGDVGRLLAKVALLIVFSFVPICLAVVALPNSLSHPVAWVSAVFWIYIVVTNAPAYFENRYWWPAVPFELVSAGVGIARLEKFMDRRKSG